jgi:predicted MFS family arabinose efflux permease
MVLLMHEVSVATTNDENTIHYPGWNVAGAAFVGVMTSFSPIVPYTFSLFLNPLHNAFGWKREALDGTFAIAAITVALVSPFIGMLLDRFPPRRIILPCILVFALALASLSRLSSNIAHFYFTFFILGLVANGTAQFAYTRTILTWFQKRRGLAIAMILTGSGVGSILIPPATQWTIAHHGWRSAYLLLGGIALLGLPLTALLVRNRPIAPVAPEEAAVSGLSVRGAFATSAFWVLCGITVLSAFSENGLVTNLAAILGDHGVTPQSAALALSVRGGSGILGRLGVGFLIDRFSPQRIQTMILLLAAGGTLILAFAGSPAVALLGATLLGVGLGSEADVLPYLLANYVGRKNFSVLYGLTWTAYAIGGATGPTFIGHMYDTAGAYQYRSIVLLAIVALAAAGVSLLLPRGKGGSTHRVRAALKESSILLEE